jgi:hypothetical protein
MLTIYTTRRRYQNSQFFRRNQLNYVHFRKLNGSMVAVSCLSINVLCGKLRVFLEIPESLKFSWYFTHSVR